MIRKLLFSFLFFITAFFSFGRNNSVCFKNDSSTNEISNFLDGIKENALSYACATNSLTGVTATDACKTSGTSTITVSASAANLPTGTYTVAYKLSYDSYNVGYTATMTVSTAGIGVFTANVSVVNATSSTSIRVDAISSSTCASVAITSNNVSNVSKMIPPTVKPSLRSSSDQTCNGNRIYWNNDGADAYYLDLSTDSNFSTYVSGFQNRPFAGTVIDYEFVGLTNGQTYYARIRSQNFCGTSVNSDTTTFTKLGNASINAIAGGASTVAVCSTTPAFTNSTSGGVWSIVNGSGSASITSGGVVTGLSAGTVRVVYTVTYSGCQTSRTQTLTVTGTATNTITLSSASGTDAQTACPGSNITPIKYNTVGATGATYSGLPSGINGSWLSNVITISGSNTVAGTYNYTVTLTGGCGALTKSGTITIVNNNTVTPSSNPTICNGVTMTSITHTTTGATGIGTPNNLPPGVTATWASNAITIGGIPNTPGTYVYSIPLNGGCGTVNATGTINVTAQNTVTSVNSNPSICINTAIQAAYSTHSTVGATGIGTISGMPNGITAAWNSNTITISGTPTQSGSFPYTIQLIGGCGTVNATGTITVNPVNTITLNPTGTNTQTVCINNPITQITYDTTGATGATVTGLPDGVTSGFSLNKVTISGTPTVTSTTPYSYTVALTGGCGTVNATGTITVNSQSTAPTLITGNLSIISGASTTLTVTGGTLGTGATIEWFAESCGGTPVGTGNTLSVSPTSTTTYYVRYTGTCNMTVCINATVNVCAPAGDEVAFGNESWIGYVYKWTGAMPDPAINSLPGNAYITYIGNVTENPQFDRNMDYNQVSGETTNINCETPPVDLFFVRYKMKTTTAAGNYLFAIGGDDGVRLYIDGQLIVGNWGNHGYTKDLVQHQLTAGSHEFVLEYFENGGGARVSISYAMTKGDPAAFGIDTWNVYGYNLSDITLPSNSYAGTYVDSNLNFDTNILWSKALSPSVYSGWQGAPMPIDDFAFTYKREGFPCGNYQLELANYDDDVEIYINGVLFYDHVGWSNQLTTVKAPIVLNKASKVEVRIREAGGDANAALNFKLVDNSYNGGTVTSTTPITISTSMSLSTNIEVCSCTIKPGVVFTVPSDKTLTVYENITVETGGKLLIENGGSLIQKSTSTTMFSGAVDTSFELKRTTPPVRRFDLTYWSSPVTAASEFTLKKLSPGTLRDKFYSYNTSTDLWVTEYDGYAVMKPGRGYNLRAPQNYEVTGDGVPFTASFIGIPNNGDIPVTTISGKWSLAGNPYPSAVDAKMFIKNNGNAVGTLYFWTHATSPSSAYPGVEKYNYNSEDFASFNLTGNTVAADPATTKPGSEPLGYIAGGQGFFFKAANGNAVKFTNDMRVAGNNKQFYKTSETEDVDTSRVWLNLKNTQGAFKQILLGYVNGASNNWDTNYDAQTLNSNNYIDFYTINGSTKLTIQGRAVPFNNTEEVPLGYKSVIASDFTISIDHVDGLFKEQAVYLEDKLTGKIQNLTAGDYTFTTAIGTFTERFVLRYTNKTLGTDDFENLENTVLVSVKDKVIKIDASKETIKDVTIFDISGKQLYEKKKLSTSELQISNLQSSNQVLLVKVTLENDFTTTKKIIFR